MLSCVPPTATTLGETDGQIGAPASLSPEAATKVTPVWPAGVVK